MDPTDKQLRDEIYVLSKVADALDHLDQAMLALSYDDLPPAFLESKGCIEQAQGVLRRETRRFRKEQSA